MLNWYVTTISLISKVLTVYISFMYVQEMQAAVERKRGLTVEEDSEEVLQTGKPRTKKRKH